MNIRKRKTNKLLSVLAVAAMLFAMTACGTTAIAAEKPQNTEDENSSVILCRIKNPLPISAENDSDTIKIDADPASFEAKKVMPPRERHTELLTANGISTMFTPPTMPIRRKTQAVFCGIQQGAHTYTEPMTKIFMPQRAVR